MGVGAQSKRVAAKLAYKTYLALFGGGSGLFGVSERIVEYPFAVNALLGLRGGARVALFGCHGDLLTTLLPTLGFETYGVDIKDFPLTFTNFTFRREDIRRTTFPSSFFDAAIAISTIEHVGLFDGDDEGDRKAMKEMRRVLKPGGLLIMTVPFASSSTVIPLRARIYDEALLRNLLGDLEVVKLSVHSTSAEEIWAQIEVEDASKPSSTITCAALVWARNRTVL